MKKIILFAILVMANMMVFAQTATLTLSKSAQKEIDKQIDAAIKADLFPGAVVLVAKDNKILYEKAYGYSEVTPNRVKMTTETLFDIASLSKCTGTLPCIMQLIEQGKVSIDDPVKKYIPDFKPWSDGKEQVDITVRQLLSHTSGLDAYLAQSLIVDLRKEWGGYSNKKTLEYIAEKAGRNFRPGTGYTYSCLNFVTLQGIVEKVTGKRLCDYARENVWKPLGMNSAHYFVEGEPLPADLPIASTEVVNGETLHGKVHDPMARLLNGGNSGNAGVFITAEDMAKYAFAILDGGDGVLKPQTVELMTRVQNDVEKENGRSLGWQVNASYCGKFNKDYCICHTGYTGTSMMIDLDQKVVVILLTNSVHPKDWTDAKHSLRSVRIAIPNIVADDFTAQEHGRSFTITAHSGAYNTEDNTMEYIDTALARKPEILEFDVRCRPDGSLAMSHDEIKSNQDGVDVADVLRKIKGHSTKVNLDIKETRVLPQLYSLLKELGMEQQVLMTGIEEKDVEAVRRDCPGIIYYLNYEPTEEMMKTQEGRDKLIEVMKSTGAEGVNCNFKYGTKLLASTLQNNGFKLSLWTINEPKDMKKYAKINPDNITTRHPDVFLQVLGEK